MLGSDILVAPVVYEGAVKRNVYLPKGTWRVEKGRQGVPETITGPQLLTDWPAPIDTLPFFVKQN